MNTKPSRYGKYPPRAIQLVKDAIKKAGCPEFNQVCYAVEDIVNDRRGKIKFNDYLERKEISGTEDIKKIMDEIIMKGKIDDLPGLQKGNGIN